jgi:hypothetical protein
MQRVDADLGIQEGIDCVNQEDLCRRLQHRLLPASARLNSDLNDFEGDVLTKQPWYPRGRDALGTLVGDSFFRRCISS